MTAQLIEGKTVAEQVETEVRAEIADLAARGVKPGIAVIESAPRPNPIAVSADSRCTAQMPAASSRPTGCSRSISMSMCRPLWRSKTWLGSSELPA